MKVFLSASPRGTDELALHYKAIYDYIAELGYSHLDDDVVAVSKKMFAQRMEKDGRKAYVDLYQRKIANIQKADICIFEASTHSLGLGFLAQRSLDNAKPTIVLYYKDLVPYFFSGIENDKLIVKSYNEKNMKKVINEALELARERRDKRFNFFLSPKLLEYLEDASKEDGVTKSKLIRDMIVEHMRKSSEVALDE